jgi:hypothetical protein
MTRLSYLLARRVNRSLEHPEGGGLSMFWPSLGLHTIDELDQIAPEFDAEVLLEAVAALEAGSKLDKELSLAAAAALRSIAEPIRHPDITPQPIRALNIAVHYLAKKELDKKSASAFLHVAGVWGISQATAKGLNASGRVDAPRVLEWIVGNRLAHGGFRERKDVLSALNSDMQWRAGSETITRPAPHKTRQKKTSLKI